MARKCNEPESTKSNQLDGVDGGRRGRTQAASSARIERGCSVGNEPDREGCPTCGHPTIAQGERAVVEADLRGHWFDVGLEGASRGVSRRAEELAR